MFNTTSSKAALAGLAALAALSASIVSAEAGDVRVRRSCTASGAGDISMSAKFEKRGQRQKFSTEFEAAPGGAYGEGDRIVIKVDGVEVGAVRLEAVVGGDLVGDLNLDTKADSPDEKPFPANWPGASRGSEVGVLKGGKTVLSCKLR